MGLSRAANLRLERTGFWFFKEYRVEVAPGVSFRAPGHRVTEQAPVALGEHNGRTLWHVCGELWWDTDGLDTEEVDLLVWDRRRRQDARLDRLRQIRAREEHVERARRERIPPEVRAFVWERDDGRCVRCGAEDDLQFDHIIPVVKGGGVAADNIQVLCGNCNRAKADTIA